jgi:tRNA (adenine22-N1)-methyltransferase
MEISVRLKTVAEFVRTGSRVADIGTDHAYLPAYLVIHNISPFVIGSDLRKGPLINAENTINEYNLENKIELRQSDGFENINPGDADDFIICGMGGTLIRDILAKAEWLKNPAYRLILQPQSHSEDVREYLINNGFKIIAEKACKDARRYYNIICAEFIGEKINKPDWYIYFGDLIFNKDECSKKITEKNLKLLKVRCEAEGKYKSKEIHDKLSKIIEDAEVIINGNQRNI